MTPREELIDTIAHKRLIDVVAPIIAEHVPRVGPPDGTHYCACGQTFGWSTTWAMHVVVLLRPVLNEANSLLLTAYEAWRDRALVAETLAGECLMSVRLALTAGDLVADGFSDDSGEPRAILTALCRDLVVAGVVDPLEDE